MKQELKLFKKELVSKMIINNSNFPIPIEEVKLDLPGDDVLSTSDRVKAQTLDHVVKHLQNVILTETRERERKRAKIALQHITKWAKHYFKTI